METPPPVGRPGRDIVADRRHPAGPERGADIVEKGLGCWRRHESPATIMPTRRQFIGGSIVRGHSPPAVTPFVRLPLFLAAVALPAQAQQRGPARPAATPQGGMTMTTVTVQQRMVIRVPRLSARPGAATSLTRTQPQTRWAEKKAGKCVPLIDIAAASLPSEDSVDLILNGGKRLRAKLDRECRALDFYTGFYVKMTPDGKACASRDAFRSRSGAECRIKAFRTLVPKR
ncbi:MAG TPA: hypothetical protein VFO80_04000 [Sphingomonas sp.]|nr:hypothetical protein [Sphingomonas sp.]